MCRLFLDHLSDELCVVILQLLCCFSLVRVWRMNVSHRHLHRLVSIVLSGTDLSLTIVNGYTYTLGTDGAWHPTGLGPSH